MKDGVREGFPTFAKISPSLLPLLHTSLFSKFFLFFVFCYPNSSSFSSTRSTPFHVALEKQLSMMAVFQSLIFFLLLVCALCHSSSYRGPAPPTWDSADHAPKGQNIWLPDDLASKVRRPQPHRGLLRKLSSIRSGDASSPSSTPTGFGIRRRGGIAQPDSPLSPSEVSDLLKRIRSVYASVTVNTFSNDDIWSHVADSRNVTIWRTDSDVKNGKTDGRRAGDGQPPVIRSRCIVNASPETVYKLFTDDSRVSEYNSNCVELHDVLRLDDSTKINWCRSPKFGPFKARDFVTVVHNRFLNGVDDGDGYSSVATNVVTPLCPPKKSYVRSSILLSATYMLPTDSPDRTEVIQVTQVGDLGGIADSKVARRIQKGLIESAPVDFLTRFNVAAMKGH